MATNCQEMLIVTEEMFPSMAVDISVVKSRLISVQGISKIWLMEDYDKIALRIGDNCIQTFRSVPVRKEHTSTGSDPICTLHCLHCVLGGCLAESSTKQIKSGHSV